ncbi:MAG: response regulator [Desulfovibrio sp.]|nr:MAG: response regulator [Desulfovibrio sp.]
MKNSVGDLIFLVVDDSVAMRRIISRTVRDMGAETVHEAGSANAALAILESERVDFIVSDWNMPGMNGIDFLVHIRQSPQHKHLPFLMVSAEAKMDNLIDAIKSGVSNYLTKPFTPDILQRKIRAILHQRF